MTITVRLPDKLEADLRARVEAEKLDLTEFVRQAIAEKLDREPQPVTGEPVTPSAYATYLSVYNGWASGDQNRAERSEEILRAKFDAKRRSRQ